MVVVVVIVVIVVVVVVDVVVVVVVVVIVVGEVVVVVVVVLVDSLLEATCHGLLVKTILDPNPKSENFSRNKEQFNPALAYSDSTIQAH